MGEMHLPIQGGGETLVGELLSVEKWLNAVFEISLWLVGVSGTIVKPENTDLLHKGKYHCMADLLFDWLGFGCFACIEFDRDLQVCQIQTSQTGGELYIDTFPYVNLTFFKF